MELLPSRLLYSPDYLKIHAMFALILSLSTEFCIEVERRSVLRISLAIATTTYEGKLQATAIRMLEHSEKAVMKKAIPAVRTPPEQEETLLTTSIPLCL